MSSSCGPGNPSGCLSPSPRTERGRYDTAGQADSGDRPGRHDRDESATPTGRVGCMASWTEFAAAAPRIAEVFRRRHAATGNLCLLGTLRPDGFPRISPMEPRFFEGTLWVGGMPGTAKFRDLVRDPRFTLHTATVDTMVGDGDAKVWGT